MILMQERSNWLFSPACHDVLAQESNHSLAGYNVGMCGCGHGFLSGRSYRRSNVSTSSDPVIQRLAYRHELAFCLLCL